MEATAFGSETVIRQHAERQGRAGCHANSGPDALADWLAAAAPQLKSWIETEIAPFVSQSRAATPREGTAQQYFRNLLALLSYAYSTGLLESVNIAATCAADPQLRAFAGNSVPFAGELNAFRRQHRRVLEIVLARLFMRARLTNAVAMRQPVPLDVQSECAKRARALLDMARHLDSCEDW